MNVIRLKHNATLSLSCCVRAFLLCISLFTGPTVISDKVIWSNTKWSQLTCNVNNDSKEEKLHQSVHGIRFST